MKRAWVYAVVCCAATAATLPVMVPRDEDHRAAQWMIIERESITLPQALLIAPFPHATGTVLVVGGTLTLPETHDFDSSLYIGAVGFTNAGGLGTLIVSNATVITPNVFIGYGAQGVLRIDHGTMVITKSGFDVGVEMEHSSGNVWINEGRLIASNTTAMVGECGRGELSLSNSTMIVHALRIGDPRTGAQGTLTLAGGRLELVGSRSTGVQIGAGGRGNFWLSAGELIATNGSTIIGEAGIGEMTISNGVAVLRDLTVAYGERGLLLMTGGTLSTRYFLNIGHIAGATGTVWLTGGHIDATDTEVRIGRGGLGELTMAGGSINARAIVLAPKPDSRGALNAGGGTLNVETSLTVGECLANAVGTINISGGAIIVTNATHTGVLEIRSGTVTLDNGLLMVDRLIATSPCARFIQNGDTLMVGTLELDPNGDTDGDGLPNGWEQAHGLNPLSPHGNDGPLGDPDRDGLSNLEEMQLGTDPNDASSPFHIIAIEQENSDIRITWVSVAGKTNLVQGTASMPGGSSATFTDISPLIITTGRGVTTTNCLDLAGSKSVPARFYRIRLVP